MMQRLLSPLVLTLAATAAQAQVFFFPRERVDIPVNAISATTFEVVRSGFASPANMWCAAGTYAERALGYTGDRIWVKSGLAPSAAGRSMVFSIEPVRPESTSYSYRLSTDGETKSMAAALGACDPLEEQVFIRTSQGTIRAW
ncbi:MAG: hypothetical protein AAFN94_01105 [Pseudomonadota bacterium]